MSGSRAKSIRRLYREVVMGRAEFPSGGAWDRMAAVLRTMPRPRPTSPLRAFKRAYRLARQNGPMFRPVRRVRGGFRTNPKELHHATT